MSLALAKPKLEKALMDAFEKSYSIAKEEPLDQDKSGKIRKQLAKDICDAVDEYVKQAQVNISSVISTVPPGVQVAAPPPSGVGSTIAPGTAQHTGFGILQ